MSTKRKRPNTDLRAREGKDSGQSFGPRDQREGNALQFVLHYAPRDAEWRKIWEVYEEEQDPQEVWGNER